MHTTYLALLEDEITVLEKLSAEQLKEIPVSIKYIIKREGETKVQTATATGSIFSYCSVDLNGKPKAIELEDFIIIDLGTETSVLHDNKNVAVQERSTGLIRKFKTQYGGGTFLTHDLLPLIRRLNQARSWETLDKFEELDRLKAENKRLEGRIETLLSEVKALKEASVN